MCLYLNLILILCAALCWVDIDFGKRNKYVFKAENFIFSYFDSANYTVVRSVEQR
jgi:hypothetical protein